ncbi:divisome protein SepX/GlpR [Nocardioides coralli]|uniref:divisome protein SepX/GlpR n=1 Tax=Nocardioides coralli TaxID=2872154 RepID=UPI001CA3B61E|nr:hypothetical protein [Nocardioides coralli]QZY29590.1 hypothetical protein K6T13_02540 [Nocardioides coralli]
MDLSALIFVALAVAWAVYLIPKALKHHDDVVRSRSVDRFSHTMRVLARREPVNRRDARLVVSPGRAPSAPIVTAKPTVRPTAQLADQRPALSRAAANRAARRRRRVLGSILVALLATVVVAAVGLISWWYVAIPAGLLVAWLVACRLMVRSEQGRRFDADLREATGEVPVVRSEVPDLDPLEDTTQTPAVTDASLWDPMPVTLPTYVGKPAAGQRSVRTIDLDSTGVWTSGRTEADAALARQAEHDDRAARAQAQAEHQRRATGS